ncbi:hypothetical protein [Spirosoma endbachense]|uniref:Copper chaperone n=1 Tax=Spirosoma endbachense TaxID=2666025 RepID=A0A6P1VR59_9BACT|nr:hypothetical protein [Spirosoma endbachense]QHV95175.1 hypothetical protein GJR95_09200 [Spirosoma endbachense]
MLNVLVFRTNINTDQRVHQVACQLCKLRGQAADAVCRWSIDLEDCDCVLRIETNSLTESDIIRLLTRAGLQCAVLN